MRKNFIQIQGILEQYYHGVPPTVLCAEYNIAPSTLYYWINKYPRKAIGYKRKEKASINWPKLFSHAKKLEAEIDFLHRHIISAIPLRERMELIDREYGKESLHVQCEALAVNYSTYVNRRLHGKGDEAWFKKREAMYTALVMEIYTASASVYGAKKITAILRKQGHKVTDKYVRNIMVNLGIKSIRDSSDKTYRMLIARAKKDRQSSLNYHPTGINQVWISDTSPVFVHKHCYWICAYVDLFSRRALACSVGRHNSTQLVKRTFLAAYAARKPKQFLLHTDNGMNYTSKTYTKCLHKLGIKQSLSRPRIPQDNAVAESFYTTLKREGIYLNGYPRSLRELEQHVADFVKRYNAERPHETLGYLTPDEFERQSLTSATSADKNLQNQKLE